MKRNKSTNKHQINLIRPPTESTELIPSHKKTKRHNFLFYIPLELEIQTPIPKLKTVWTQTGLVFAQM